MLLSTLHRLRSKLNWVRQTLQPHCSDSQINVLPFIGKSILERVNTTLGCLLCSLLDEKDAGVKGKVDFYKKIFCLGENLQHTQTHTYKTLKLWPHPSPRDMPCGQAQARQWMRQLRVQPEAEMENHFQKNPIALQQRTLTVGTFLERAWEVSGESKDRILEHLKS